MRLCVERRKQDQTTEILSIVEEEESVERKNIKRCYKRN